ncbi:hypothetical protein BD779DRAFT_1476384 [Infundibulicybe gibba]|nr:hypothetical protein BD779DRAFT_1476384 [Infundibulicybe gibba]
MLLVTLSLSAVVLDTLDTRRAGGTNEMVPTNTVNGNDLFIQTDARVSENAEGARTAPSVFVITRLSQTLPMPADGTQALSIRKSTQPSTTPPPPAAVTALAYPNDAQQQATEVTGQTAGVLQATNESTPAAIAYGLDRLDSLVTAAYDPGGGAFGTRPTPHVHPIASLAKLF